MHKFPRLQTKSEVGRDPYVLAIFSLMQRFHKQLLVGVGIQSENGSDVIFHERGHGLGYACALPWHSLERPQLTLERLAAEQLLQPESKVPLEYSYWLQLPRSWCVQTTPTSRPLPMY